MRVLIFCIFVCLQCFTLCLGDIIAGSTRQFILKTETSADSEKNINPMRQNKTGGFLLSFNAGEFYLKNLDVGETLERSYSDKAKGPGFGSKVGYFLNQYLIIGLDFNYMSITWKTYRGFTGLIASKINYSFVQYGTFIIYSPSFPKLHYKLGLRMIRLRTDNRGVLNMPGIELAIGRKIFNFEGATIFGEFAFGYLFSNNKKPDIAGVTDPYTYPYNLRYFGFKVGVLFSIGRKSME